MRSWLRCADDRRHRQPRQVLKRIAIDRPARARRTVLLQNVASPMSPSQVAVVVLSVLALACAREPVRGSEHTMRGPSDGESTARGPEDDEARGSSASESTARGPKGDEARGPIVSESTASLGAPLSSTPSTRPPSEPPASPTPSSRRCPCQAGELCIRQSGHPGPTRRDEPPPSFMCVQKPADCTASDECMCLHRGLQRCWVSRDAPHACECDNGMR